MEKYHIIMRILHWSMALCILGLIACGIYMEGLKPEEGKYVFYGWHKSFGMLVIVLFIARVITRKLTKVPPLPDTIKKQDQKLSHIAHILLYILMIGVPVAGYLMSSFGGHSVSFFGIKLPELLEKNKELGGIAHALHGPAAFALLAVVVLHVAGALKHRFFEPPENNVLRRMM